MEGFDAETLREYAGRLLEKVQSQARDLQRMVCVVML